jgi:hypothetical protein
MELGFARFEYLQADMTTLNQPDGSGSADWRELAVEACLARWQFWSEEQLLKLVGK